MKNFVKRYKKRVGKKGFKFTTDVCKQMANPKSGINVVKSFRSGVTKQRIKAEEKYEKKWKAVCEENMKTFVETVCSIPVYGMMIHGYCNEGDELYNKLLRKKEMIYEEIEKEIDNKEYEYIYNLDDEKNRPVSKVLTIIFTNRIFLDMDLDETESKIFWEVYYGTFLKECEETGYIL